MKFYTSYSPAPSLPEPKCPKVRQRLKLDKTNRELVFTEKEPFYDQIQSYKESASLSNILARAQLGDVSALGTDRGSYVDVSGCPTNLIEMHQINQKGQSIFANLPDYIRHAFGDSQAIFNTCLANGSAADIIKTAGELHAKRKAAGTTGAGSGSAGTTGAGTTGAGPGSAGSTDNSINKKGDNAE